MIPQLLRRTKVLRNNKQLLNKKTTTIDLRTIASQQGRLMCRRVHLSNHNMKIFPTHLGNGNYHTGQQKKPFVRINNKTPCQTIKRNNNGNNNEIHFTKYFHSSSATFSSTPPSPSQEYETLVKQGNLHSDPSQVNVYNSLTAKKEALTCNSINDSDSKCYSSSAR